MQDSWTHKQEKIYITNVPSLLAAIACLGFLCQPTLAAASKRTKIVYQSQFSSYFEKAIMHRSNSINQSQNLFYTKAVKVSRHSGGIVHIRPEELSCKIN